MIVLDTNVLSALMRTTPDAVVRPESEVPTLTEFSKTFLESYAESNNEASTVREKRRTIKRALLPLLGNLRLDQIRARDIETYKAKRLATKTRKGKPPAHKTVNEELAILNKILGVAVEWEIRSGAFWVKIRDRWFEVPAGRTMHVAKDASGVPTDPNPWQGEAILFWEWPDYSAQPRIYCFQPPDLT